LTKTEKISIKKKVGSKNKDLIADYTS